MTPLQANRAPDAPALGIPVLEKLPPRLRETDELKLPSCPHWIHQLT
jgi:hypothetical protein